MGEREARGEGNSDTREQGGLLGLVEYPLPETSEAVEAAIRSERSRSLVLLDKPMAPPERSPHDRLVLLGLLASLLLHASLVLLVPQGERLLAVLGRPRQPAEEEIPPVYLLPYLPRERVEPPSSQRAPRSDLDRRAHGGEGAPSDTPGMRGNTFEPRLEPPSTGGGVPQGAPPAAAGSQVPPAAESPEERAAPKAEGTDQRGADAVLHAPKSAQPEGQPMLKGLSSAGQGIGGSGSRPDRRGGQVDLGPLSFDTEWYDWGPYAREMLRRIRYHWAIPEIARWGVPGVVRIRFYIERDGRVTGLTIEAVSGHPSMDFAARDAILNASPLPPLPVDLTGVDREGVTITFYYNTRPPDGSFTDE